MVANAPTHRLGVVSFVNTIPLVHGLERLARFELRSSVPSLLIDQLLADEVDVALCSSVDYQRSPDDLIILPAGLLGCDGPTLTVRVYADRPIETLERVYCDTDSHTSVSLLRILLREHHGIDVACVPFEAREHVADDRPVDWPEAVLLIGDKVVTDSPPAVRYPHQLDLGRAWKEWTGLPFVFALWVARATCDRHRLRTISAVLDRQRRANQMRIQSIINRAAVPRGWPLDLATAYLTEYIRYTLEDRFLEGLELFYTKLVEHGLCPAQRPVEVLSTTGG